MNRIFKLFSFIILFNFSILNAQSITIDANTYKQKFEGVGTSIGLYIYHHFSMNNANQVKALELINKDLNMTFIQDYIQYYPSETAYYDIRANYIKKAKVYQPNSKIAMVYDNFPDELRKDKTVSGSVIRILDVTRPSIYDDLADWYFQSLKGFQERGVEVDILSVCNEPDYTRQHHFGYGNPRVGVARILQDAVPKLKAMLANPTINITNIKVPLIMAPSNLSTVSCLQYVQYFKSTYPSAWAQIDIVATHQYGNGYDETTIQNIKNELDGRAFYQSEMHADHSDNLNIGTAIDRPHRASLDLSGLFNVAMNNGVESWFYFENNYPQEYHPGGLIHVPWAGTPNPYKHYYAFKQITSRQPINTYVLEQDLTNLISSEVSSFRKIDGDTIYLNVSNFTANSKEIPIEIKKNINENYGIKFIETMTTNATLNAELTQNLDFTESVGSYTLSAPPYSINTLTIALDPEFNGSLSNITYNKKPSFNIYSDYDLIRVVPINGLQIKYLQIFSIIGQQLSMLESTDYGQIHTFKVPNGIYIVKIMDALGNSFVKKIYVK